MINSIVVSLLVFVLLLSKYFVISGRFSSINQSVLTILSSVLSSRVGFLLFYSLLVTLFVVNLTGNIPLNTIPSLFYSQTVTISLLFWVPIILCISLSQAKGFIAHLLPYGAPSALSLVLPIIELFSQLIRPFTLIIRLSTNLSSGHIIIYMFSYFTLLSSVLSPFIHIVISVLFVLELCISMLQAYIFVSLLGLYVNETL